MTGFYGAALKISLIVVIHIKARDYFHILTSLHSWPTAKPVFAGNLPGLNLAAPMLAPYFVKALCTVAAEAGISRETLYRALSPKGNPTLKTLLAVLKAVGMKLSVEPEQRAAA